MKTTIKQPYWLTCSPEELEAIAAQYDDQWEPGTHGHGKATAFHWLRMPRFPVATLNELVNWQAFWDEEVRTWSDEGQPHRFDDMVEWWRGGPLGQPEGPPIVLVRSMGVYCIWDGMHRTAISCIHGLATIPAILGVRKMRC